MKALQYYKTEGYRKYSVFSLHCWHNDNGQIHIYLHGILYSFDVKKAKEIKAALNHAIAQIETEQYLQKRLTNAKAKTKAKGI